jgi:hypothetical protein
LGQQNGVSMEMETPTPVPHVEASGTEAPAWELVGAYDRLIKRIVRAAVRRGRIRPDVAEDALANARLLAYDLAHYLAATLSRELRYDLAHLKDALDRARAVEPEGSINENGDANDYEDWFDNVLGQAAEDTGVSYNESKLIAAMEPPPRAPTLDELIARLPGPQAAIARMAFLEHVSPEQIVRRTGRTPDYIHRTLKYLERIFGIPT